MGRTILIAAEDTAASAYACDWALRTVYRQGDEVHLVYVVLAMKPPMEVFHGLPGTAYTFAQPGPHQELELISAAKAALEARFLPVLKAYDLPTGVPYKLQLYAERTDAKPERVGELILKRADEVDACIVVAAAHNKPTLQLGFQGSVAQYIVTQCRRPLGLVRPPETDWHHVSTADLQ